MARQSRTSITHIVHLLLAQNPFYRLYRLVVSTNLVGIDGQGDGGVGVAQAGGNQGAGHAFVQEKGGVQVPKAVGGYRRKAQAAAFFL
jgi:hypothetical protein